MENTEEGNTTEEEESRTNEKIVRFLKKDFDTDDSQNEGTQEREGIMVIGEENNIIRYDKMQGRPSVTIEIQDEHIECLLDTGARINVMNWKTFQRFQGVILTNTDITLHCANDGELKVKGKARLKVTISGMTRWITFTIVQQLTPDVIGGVEMQNEFRINLVWKRDPEEHISNIVAQFGKKISGEERFQRAKETLKTCDPKIIELIRKYQDVFMATKWDIGCTTLLKHKIKTRGDPINIKPRRQPVNLESKIDEAIKNLRDNNIIKECNSPWNTPLICVWKKEKQDIRLCLDFRQLNLVTERPAFPMPNIAEILDKLGGAKYFTSIDLGNAYYQVELDEESKEKTAFSTKMGQFCFNRMPFGIAAAPGTFQELMLKVLKNKDCTAVYLDDILIFTKSMEHHYEILEEVLKEIKDAGLRINPEKCHIQRKEVKFLGHIINGEGIQTDPAKTEAIKTFQQPKCIKNLRSFLGICNYYRRFIKGYAEKSRILEELCGKKEKKLVWTEKCQESFEGLKKALTTAPVLGFPDFSKEFILDTDASFDTIGAVLSQRNNDGYETVIAYGSHAMNSHEKGYCITRKELLAIHYFCQHFNHYLYGRRFTLRTDHKAITFMLKTKKPITTQFQTWINLLSSYDINLEYRKGSKHSNADMLSRNTCGTCTQCLLEHEQPKQGKLTTRRINAVHAENESKWQKENTEIENIKEEVLRDISWKFIVENGIVKTKEGKIWIPEVRRKEMIKEIHSALSHAGFEKTISYIRCNYDMKNMKEIIRQTVRHCEACQKVKTVTTATKEETIKLSANEPFEKIYIDICGPLKETFRKKKYILAIIDQFSRYIVLSAIARQDEETIKNTIMNAWVLRFGAPREIHTDCGKVFQSETILQMAKSLGTIVQLSSPYHHNTNGIIERQFRTIREYINASLKERTNTDWAEILPEIEFTLNATTQKSIGRSPAEIVFGRKIFREQFRLQNTEPNNAEGDLENIATRRSFNPGDDVLIVIENRTKDKDRYEGPYQVVRKIHDRRYLLRDKRGKIIERNIEKMKQFFKEGGCEDG